jgi:hypothetical protein
LLRVGGEDLPLRATLYNNDLLLRRGLGPLFDDAARQPAGRIGLFNTDPVLRETEIQSVVQGREVGLAGYNDYRAYCRFPRGELRPTWGDASFGSLSWAFGAHRWSSSAVVGQGPGKVVTGVRLEMIGVDAPLLDGAGRA